jgi:hypothetical protein
VDLSAEVFVSVKSWLTNLSFHRILRVRPVLEQRLKNLRDSSFKPPPDLIQLVIDGTKNDEGRTLDYQVNAQIGTGRAALLTY